VNQWQE